MVSPEPASRKRTSSSGWWVFWVALVVASAWWYPTARDRWLAPKDTEASAAGSTGSARPGMGPGGMRSTPVSVVKARLLDIRVTVAALGHVTALNTAVVRAKVDGELQAIRFTEGQMVQAGAVLAQIDPRPYELALQQAQGQLARDQATLRNAQIDGQRYQELLAKDAIARQQVETQESLIKQLEGTVATDRALVDNARLQLSYTRVTAPISGRLGLKQVELGSLVRASDPAGLVTITQTQPMAVVFAVPDVHVPDIQRKLKSGTPLWVQAFDRNFKPLAQGQLSATDNAIAPATGTLTLKALLDTPEGNLFPNQFAQVRLQLATAAVGAQSRHSTRGHRHLRGQGRGRSACQPDQGQAARWRWRMAGHRSPRCFASRRCRGGRRRRSLARWQPGRGGDHPGASVTAGRSRPAGSQACAGARGQDRAGRATSGGSRIRRRTTGLDGPFATGGGSQGAGHEPGGAPGVFSAHA